MNLPIKLSVFTKQLRQESIPASIELHLNNF